WEREAGHGIAHGRRKARKIAGDERRVRHAREQRSILRGSQSLVASEEQRFTPHSLPTERAAGLVAIADLLAEVIAGCHAAVSYVVVRRPLDLVRARLGDDG